VNVDHVEVFPIQYGHAGARRERPSRRHHRTGGPGSPLLRFPSILAGAVLSRELAPGGWSGSLCSR